MCARRIFHSWGKWEDGTATWISPLFGHEWTSAIQTRTCQECGKVKVRRLS